MIHATMDEPQEPKPPPPRRPSPRAPQPHAHHAATGDARLDIIDAERRLDPAASRWLHDAGLAAIRAATTPRSPGGHVRLMVVGDARMSDLHRRHSGVDGPTDVLTFDLRESPAQPLDADIAVCVDEAARQARARGIAPERELLLYLVHGVLHCLGHDDHDDDAFDRMHRREDEILEAIGVGATFAPPDGAATEPAR